MSLRIPSQMLQQIEAFRTTGKLEGAGDREHFSSPGPPADYNVALHRRIMDEVQLMDEVDDGRDQDQRPQHLLVQSEKYDPGYGVQTVAEFEGDSTTGSLQQVTYVHGRPSVGLFTQFSENGMELLSFEFGSEGEVAGVRHSHFDANEQTRGFSESTGDLRSMGFLYGTALNEEIGDRVNLEVSRTYRAAR